jgi:hypothetical protein
MFGRFLLLRNLTLKDLVVFILGAFTGATFPAATNQILDKTGIRHYVQQIMPAGMQDAVNSLGQSSVLDGVLPEIGKDKFNHNVNHKTVNNPF